MPARNVVSGDFSTDAKVKTAGVINHGAAARLIGVDTATDTLVFGSSSTPDSVTRKVAVDTSSTQTIGTGKTITTPVINSPTVTTPTTTGAQTSDAAAGAAGSSVRLQNTKTLVDNAVTDIFTVTVPNVIVGAAIDLYATSTLGDGDSTDSARYSIGISRIAGAATKAVASAKSVVGATAGAGANAVITVTVSAMAGAVGATQTFTVTIKNARSAGAADNHPTTVIATLVNSKAGGATFAIV